MSDAFIAAGVIILLANTCWTAFLWARFAALEHRQYEVEEAIRDALEEITERPLKLRHKPYNTKEMETFSEPWTVG